MSILILDADRSLSTIGGPQQIQALCGMPELTIDNGVPEVYSVLYNLFVAQYVNTQHPVLTGEKQEVEYFLSDKAKALGLDIIVLDTVSRMANQSRRILANTVSKQPGRLDQSAWGDHGEQQMQFYEFLAKLPMTIIANSHLEDLRDDISGGIDWVPAVKGGAKTRVEESFDVVLFSERDQEGNYVWITKPQYSKRAKDRRDLLPEVIPQDYSLVIPPYKADGIEHPKILCLGRSGTGKTRSLTTIAKFQQPSNQAA